MKHAHLIVPRTLVAGSASGELLYATTGLSFWGGVDPRSAEVIDRHHPLSGRHLHGRLLAIPGGRGSCTGSSVLLELILGGRAPAAILLREPDEILALGDRRRGTVRPLATHRLSRRALRRTRRLSLGAPGRRTPGTPPRCPAAAGGPTRRSAGDRCRPTTGRLRPGPARRRTRRSRTPGDAHRPAHGGVAGRATADRHPARAHRRLHLHRPGRPALRRDLRDLGARVRVPTTLNAISVDQRRWREQGVPAALGEPAAALARAYLDMGAQPASPARPTCSTTARGPANRSSGPSPTRCSSPTACSAHAPTSTPTSWISAAPSPVARRWPAVTSTSSARRGY